MAEDLTKVIPLGACAISFNSVDLGDTTKNTKVTFKTKYVPQQAGKYGEVPVAFLRAGTQVDVEAELIQTDVPNIQGAGIYPYMTKVTGGGGTKLTFGEVAGKLVTKSTLTLTSVLSDNSQSTDLILTLTQAAPVGDPELMYSGEGFQVWKVKFTGCVDTGQAAGAYIGSFGKPSATQDAVAPTVSSVVPADAATGVSTDTSVVWTLSKALNGNTVNNYSVKLVNITDDAEVACGAPVLVNNGASTTITLTPSSALTGSKTYAAILTNAIQDQYGNALTTKVSEFTTA